MHSLHNYQVNISCLPEVKLGGADGCNIKVHSADGRHWFAHSDPKSPIKKKPAVALRQRTNSALSFGQPFSSKIDVTCSKSQLVNVTVVVIYAQNLPCDCGGNDEFYDSLQTAASYIPKRGMLSIANY